MESDRRVTLGTISQSVMNARPNINNNVGSMVVSNDTNVIKNSRMSMGVPANRIIPSQGQSTKRMSMGVPLK